MPQTVYSTDDALTAALDMHNEGVAELEAKISDLEEQVSDLEDEISTLESECDEKNAEIEELTDSIAAFKSDFQGVL